MSEPPAPSSEEKWMKLADEVRLASKSGRLLPLGDAWSGTEEEYMALEPELRSCGLEDISLIREGGEAYLYSDHHMTPRYARTAALAASGDLLPLIAETVRFDSATYPRPTPVETFEMEPFRLPMETITAALENLAEDARYQDIQSVRASDGSLFLFSTEFMQPPHARSLAEWIAVKQLDNP